MVESKIEKRGTERTAARVPVSIKTQAGGVQATGYTRDLSANGIFLYTDAEIVEGSEVEMVLMLPAELTHGEKGWVCCQASVVRVEERGKDGQVGVAARISKIEMLPEIMG
jgi:hypothetical protein